MLKRLTRFTYLGDMLRAVLVRATSPDDIESARQAGKSCLYLTGNGVPLADWRVGLLYRWLNCWVRKKLSASGWPSNWPLSVTG